MRPIKRRVPLKNLRAPRCLSRLEDPVCLCNCAGEQLLNPQSACQLAPSKSPQVHRAKGTDIATQAGASSGCSTPSEPIRQQPAFQGQNSSITSMTKEPRAWYDRADIAVSISTRRTQSPSLRVKSSRRGSAISRRSGWSTGNKSAFTRAIQSMSSKYRQIPRVAAGEAATISIAATEPVCIPR
jgi:hypothetical protein